MRSLRETEFFAWLNATLPATLPDDVAAFSFNLAESPASFVVEVVGASTYDVKDSDWACGEAWTHRPESFDLSYAEFGEGWETVLSLIEKWVRTYLATSAPGAQMLRSAQAVAIGFVDGDLAIIHQTTA